MRELAPQLFDELLKAVVDVERGTMATDGWLEFDSMINLRPRQGNRSRSVEDPQVRERIAAIVARLVVADG